MRLFQFIGLFSYTSSCRRWNSMKSADLWFCQSIWFLYVQMSSWGFRWFLWVLSMEKWCLINFDGLSRSKRLIPRSMFTSILDWNIFPGLNVKANPKQTLDLYQFLEAIPMYFSLSQYLLGWIACNTNHKLCKKLFFSLSWCQRKK